MGSRYESGAEGEYEPGSRGRMLCNLLGIRRVGDMQFAESQALDAVQVWAIGNYDSHHRFSAADIRELHRRWMGGIYPAEMDPARLAAALARSHAELVLIHPFREGNGRCARLLALLMAMQAGLPTLDFWGLAGRGKRQYIAAIHAALNRDYRPMQACFTDAIRRTSDFFGK